MLYRLVLLSVVGVSVGCVRGFETPWQDEGTGTPDLDARTAPDLDSGADSSDLFVLPDAGLLGDLGFSCTCAGADLNNDGKVDLDDWQIFTDCYGKGPEGQCATSDFSGDGVIGLNDFGCFKKMYNSC